MLPHLHFYSVEHNRNFKKFYRIIWKWGSRMIGISGSLIWSDTLMELIFNPCGEFRWSPEGPVSQAHSPHLHVGAPAIFSHLLRSVQMPKIERGGAESYGPYSSLVKLRPWFLSCDGRPAFGQNCSLGTWVCSERPALGQNTLMMIIEFTGWYCVKFHSNQGQYYQHSNHDLYPIRM